MTSSSSGRLGLLSILIINWNGHRYIYDCLESIRQHVTVPCEVIVVDNHSSDGSPEEIERRFPWVKLIRSEDNSGFARANNLAARQATGKYLLLLNNDTALRTDIADAVRLLEADAAMGAVGAEMYGVNGEIRPSCAHFPTPFRLWVFASMWHVPTAVWKVVDGVPVRRCDYVEGSFLLTPAAAWRALGGMDERNYMYGDDVDYCRSLLNAGYATVQCPSVRYMHAGGYDHSRMAYLFSGFRRYHRKFSGRLTRLHAGFVLRVGLFLRLPWYWWLARSGDKQSRMAFENALQLHRNWKETGLDAYRHRS
jgi:N-acetylglucosaminyl-diphospho-decaprenol L-rhamnosyltransferase